MKETCRLDQPHFSSSMHKSSEGLTLVITCWLGRIYFSPLSLGMSFSLCSVFRNLTCLGWGCLPNVCPFHLPPPLCLLTAMYYWPTTPTHLLYDFFTCNVDEGCLRAVPVLPNFPHYLLIIRQICQAEPTGFSTLSQSSKAPAVRWLRHFPLM